MNFQAVSVGQKLIEKATGTTGGYLDSVGTPTAALLSEIKFADASIGEWVSELKKQGIYDNTLIVVTAKHGQSPVDSARYTRITHWSGNDITSYHPGRYGLPAHLGIAVQSDWNRADRRRHLADLAEEQLHRRERR